jgi:mono/diheme cytochrome c family protein
VNRYVVVLASFALGCSGEDGGKDGTGDEVDAILALTPDLDNGAALYQANCALCHGENGEGIEGLGSDVRTQTDQRAVVEVVLDGNDEGMTAFRDFLTEQEIADVSGYVVDGTLGG